MITFSRSRKYWGGGLWLPVVSPFLAMFKEVYALRVANSKECFESAPTLDCEIIWDD